MNKEQPNNTKEWEEDKEFQERKKRVVKAKQKLDKMLEEAGIEIREREEREEKEREELIESFGELGERIEKDYNSQVEIYNNLGILEILSSGEQGIEDKQGNEYPIPTIEEVIKRVSQRKDLQESLETLENPKILLVPFALENKVLVDKLGEQMLEKQAKGELLDHKRKELKLGQLPVAFNDELKNLKYFPEWTSDNEPKNGITKEEAIEQEGGWRILIVEDIPNSKDNDKNNTVYDYQEEYKKEGREGLTVEDYISLQMISLAEKNTILETSGNWTRLFGNNTEGSYVPCAYWNSDNGQVHLTWNSPRNSHSISASRPAVKV
jgi:hypothetical protein